VIDEKDGKADPGIQNYIGIIYRYEDSKIKQDYTLAKQWFIKSANQGYKYGQFNLGRLYRDGLGVEQDGESAYMWIKKAADQGYTEAQSEMDMFNDSEKSIEIYTQLAESGFLESQKTLGILYYYGKKNYAEKDYSKAFFWLKKYVDGSNDKKKTVDANVQYCTGNIYYNGYGGVEKNYQLARQYFEDSAYQRNRYAQYYLGFLFLYGHGVKQH
jgi:TPR repeat protein